MKRILPVLQLKLASKYATITFMAFYDCVRTLSSVFLQLHYIVICSVHELFSCVCAMSDVYTYVSSVDSTLKAKHCQKMVM